MASIKQIKEWLPAALEQFNTTFPFSRDVETKITVASRAKAIALHYAAIEATGAKPSDYLPNTDAETFIGPNGCTILIYSWQIKNQPHFNRVFWHEMGHRCDYIFNAKFRDYVTDHFNEDDLICGGYSIWSEFIAEIMYYAVSNEEPDKDYRFKVFTMNSLLLKAINHGEIFPYDFAHYAAMVMEDPTIEAVVRSFPDRVDFGLSQLREPVAERVGEILKMLDKQLCKDDYWVVGDAFLQDLGRGFNDLWDECFTERIQFSIDAGVSLL